MELYLIVMKMPAVACVKGKDLYRTVSKSLELIKDEIRPKKHVLIKPNMVSAENQLSATHVEHVKALADFFEGKCDKIIVAESTALGSTEDGFRNFGYDRLKGVELINLDKEEHVKVGIFDSKGKKLHINVSKMLMDKKNFVVSAAKMKTHDTVVATLSAKNIIMSSMIEKREMHQGYRMTNKNLAKVMKHLHIDLASIDGINGMEGNGPVDGTAASAGCVLASTDFLAADRVALEIMGIYPENVGYLNYIYGMKLGEFDLGKIKIIGDQIEKKKFILHKTAEKQFVWR
ncbi:MAG: DUF362 domain-containing protein [Candidatus Aenigmarchaeota archaeon]|nr:DUF362 domain-containing protein [Candidatus Aenigmarchaeota archaeon]